MAPAWTLLRLSRSSDACRASGSTCTRSIQAPGSSAKAARLASLVSQPAAINHGLHREIMRQAIGVVHIRISGETAEHRLPQQTG